MDTNLFIKMKKAFEQENKKYDSELKELPETLWPKVNWIQKPVKVFRSRSLIVQVFEEEKGMFRISVNRTEVERCEQAPGGWRFRDGLAWDTLQVIKNAIGFEEFDAVEIYPTGGDEVNISNMRHLWVCPAPVWFAWRNPNKAKKLILAHSMAEAGQILRDGR